MPITAPAATRRAVLLGSLAAPLVARAQPIGGGKPIRLVVPYAAGGAVDMVGRLAAERMGPALGQEVVVDNRSGAAGIVGADAVAKARPDGGTLGVIGMTTLCAYKALYSKLPFDPDTAFAPVSQISAGTVVCCVNPARAREEGWTDFRALVAWAKQRPEQLRFGYAGVGTTAHFMVAALQQATGARLLMVTYRGGAPAVADLQAGVIDMMFELTPGLTPLIESGDALPLAVGSRERLPALPQVPAMGEFGDLGLAGYDIQAWEAVMAPAGTPPGILARLNAAVRAAGDNPVLAERLRPTGFRVATSASPGALAGKIREEIPLWRRLVEVSGARLD
ncbi:Bug family tripartite tricarboxylate transporter substrate binding protein [Dankookia sp. P2]|uniref:Bug family tripartite tricarboxylate transporter substrate binding protein n=1 Tax=Dankookia sp. P2 TaxID=3423955 RepID=UPI003D668C27